MASPRKTATSRTFGPLTPAKVAAALESSGSEYIADVSGQFISNIDSTAFDKFLLLRSVNVSFNALERINGLQLLVDLRELRLNNNKLASIDGLEKCKKLERLHLQNNAIRRIAGLTEGKFLKQVRLDNNQIEVYEGLDKCLSLEDLDLSRNHIRTIAGIKSRSMTTLRLSNNELSEIKLGDLAGMQALEELHLDGNRLWAAPGLSSLTNLMSLNLANNGIVCISDIGTLPNLLDLDLSGNKLVSLAPRPTSKATPAWSTLLPKLESLDVSGNLLVISGTTIESLLTPLASLSALAELFLADNPCSLELDRSLLVGVIRSTLPNLMQLDDETLRTITKDATAAAADDDDGLGPSPTPSAGAAQTQRPASRGGSASGPPLLTRPASASVRPGSARPKSAMGAAARPDSATAKSTLPPSAATPVGMLKSVISQEDIFQQTEKAKDLVEKMRQNWHARLSFAEKQLGGTGQLAETKWPASQTSAAIADGSQKKADAWLTQPSSSPHRSSASSLSPTTVQTSARASPTKPAGVSEKSAAPLRSLRSALNYARGGDTSDAPVSSVPSKAGIRLPAEEYEVAWKYTTDERTQDEDDVADLPDVIATGSAKIRLSPSKPVSDPSWSPPTLPVDPAAIRSEALAEVTRRQPRFSIARGTNAAPLKRATATDLDAMLGGIG